MTRSVGIIAATLLIGAGQTLLAGADFGELSSSLSLRAEGSRAADSALFLDPRILNPINP